MVDPTDVERRAGIRALWSAGSYAAVGDLSDEERAMVRDGTRELLAALAATRPSN